MPKRMEKRQKFEPTRSVVRMGDPGIDARWVGRRTLGLAVACVWLIGFTIGIGVMAAASIGPIGWIEGWQARTSGTVNPVFAALPFMVLPFAPWLTLLLPADASRPFLLGLQQACSVGKGPRFLPSGEMRARRMVIARRATTTVLMLGLVALVGGVGFAWHEATAPAPPPVTTTYADVVAGRAARDVPVRIVGAIEQGPSWTQRTRTRNATIVTRWRALAPVADARPRALVERVASGLESDDAEADAGATLTGRLRPLDEWTADRLREAGFVLTEQPLVLVRSKSAEDDLFEASTAGALVAVLGLVAAFLSGITRWRLTRSSPG